MATPVAPNPFAEAAFRNGKPLLLEIPHWGRENPVTPGTHLAYPRTSFFKLDPQPPEATAISSYSVISRYFEQEDHPSNWNPVHGL